MYYYLVHINNVKNKKFICTFGGGNMQNQFSAILGAKRLSMTDVFKATQISRTTLHGLYYEKTKNPDSLTVMKICEYLNITPNEFYGIDQYRED